MSTPTQDYRPIQLISEFGKDVLLFHSMDAIEQLSQPFEYRIHAYSLDFNLDFKKIIGTPMSVCLELPEDRQRYFNGWVSEFSQVPTESERYSYYRIVLRPWLWFLSRYSDCRFFQDKSIPDILEDIFNDRGYEDYDLGKLNRGDYPKREYYAQYRETDFNFVSRRTEEEGIYYYFEHTAEKKHILTLVDEPSDHDTVQGYESLAYTKAFIAGSPARDAVFACSVSHSAQPSGYALNSFYFEKPSNPLYKLVEPEAKHPQVKAVIYDYNAPDFYRDINNGERYAKIRLEELHAAQEIIHAKTNAAGLTTGKKFTLTEHPRDDQNREYLVIATRISLRSNQYESAGSGYGEQVFDCEFTALEATQQYRPPRHTPVPIVQGPQTAIVVPEEGQESEEISTDKHGRVKVRFHWNRPQEDMSGKNQQERSCWIRVSNPWAGKSWGAMAIPRIGQEVIVDFEEGHTDRPIITGRVYNGEQPVPYPLPASKNMSGIKSDSTKGGGGYNEIMMDDTKNKELIRIHAQYDMDTTVEHDDRQTVHNNRTINVDGTHTETIIKDTKITISEGNYEHKVNTGTGTYYVKGAVKEDYDNKQETTVTNEIVTKSKTSHIHMTAATEIKLEVGASTLLMKADGSIKLSGINVAIDGSASVNIHGLSVTSQADADHNTKGAIVISEGSATNTVKGGMVMLNP